MRVQTDRFSHDISRLLREKYRLADSPSAAYDISRLLSGEPLDYVIGWVPFLDVAIDLSCRPFIPRPETEWWTREAIARYRRAAEKRLRVLDMFSGSGAIAIAWARQYPKSTVTAAEKDPRFIQQIAVNQKKNKIPPARFHVVRSDLFQNIRGVFDIILANPPYVDARHHVDASVRRFEPREAYYGGRDGLAVIRRFLKEARKHLVPGGEIWMEHGSWQKPALEKLLRQNGYRRYSFHRDQYGRWRYAVAGMEKVECGK